jgi:pyruvate dehydrogenase E1 component beta subunit
MSKMTMMEAIRETIRLEMRKDPLMFMIGEDVGPYGGEMGLSKGLWEEFGDKRMRDFPISEATIIGCGLGASLTGCKAIAEIPFMDFLGVAMDQVYNQAAKVQYMFGGKARVPLVIRTPMGGYQGGAAQHSQCLESWFTHVPGLKVVTPSNAADAAGLLHTALADENPVMFIEHKKLYSVRSEVEDLEAAIEFGKARTARAGKDLTIVAYSYMVKLATEAAERLAKDGIDVEIVDPRTLVPLDEHAIVNSVSRTGRALVVYESWERGGYGAEIAAMIGNRCFGKLKAPVKRVAAKNVPIPFSPPLEEFVLPSVESIAVAARELIKES